MCVIEDLRTVTQVYRSAGIRLGKVFLKHASVLFDDATIAAYTSDIVIASVATERALNRLRAYLGDGEAGQQLEASDGLQRAASKIAETIHTADWIVGVDSAISGADQPGKVICIRRRGEIDD